MRLGELLGRVVVTEDGRTLGPVQDVRLVQDGPLLGVWGHALRIDALVAGPGALRERLGMRRQASAVPWEDVVDLGQHGHPIVVRSRSCS